MLHIKNIAQLKECLLSDKLTGLFITPVEEFVKSGDIIKYDNRAEYFYQLDDVSFIKFQISQNVIVFKGYCIKPEKHYVYHRLNNKPATLFYLKNGELNTTSWFINGSSVREHPMQPVMVEHCDGDYWKFQYAKTEDEFFEISYIIFDKKKTGTLKILDMLVRYRGENLNLKHIKKRYPFIEDLTFEDCYDLSINIFTDDQITLMRMIDI